MSEGLAMVRLLSADTGALSARWSRGAHTSEMFSEAHFQMGAIFINKPQIWVLKNYILTDDVSQVHKYRQGPCPKWNTLCALAVLQTYNGLTMTLTVHYGDPLAVECEKD